jgi:hypothetical protein
MQKIVFFFVVLLFFAVNLRAEGPAAPASAPASTSENVAKPDTPAQPAVAEPETESNSNLQVEIKLGNAIENKEISGEASTFSLEVGKVYCWTLVKGATPPVTIKHVWKHGDETVVEVPLEVKSSSFRTWSYKSITPDMTGKWQVIVMDEQGGSLASANFEINAEQPEQQTEPQAENESK